MLRQVRGYLWSRHVKIGGGRDAPLPVRLRGYRLERHKDRGGAHGVIGDDDQRGSWLAPVDRGAESFTELETAPPRAPLRDRSRPCPFRVAV